MINGHGGNIFDKAALLGCDPMDILDMSSNVNPLGPLPGLMAHLAGHLDRITALPDAGAGRIIAAFADRHGIDPESVLAGNGTTQLIYTLPLALPIRKALILGPTYSDYADACRMHGADFRYLLSDAGHAFIHDLAGVDPESADTVFVCSPNNPTGVLIPRDEILTACRRHPEIRFIVDESYLPFVPGGEAKSLIAASLPNLIVLNSMSKIFRIPGLRIGFIAAPPDIIEAIRRFMLPWSVNTLAQAAVDYLMTRKEEVHTFIEKTRQYLAGERDFVMKAFEDLPGIRFFPSTTSFILARLDHPAASDVADELLKSRILIRNCANFAGLSEQYIRISLKTRDVNEILTDRLQAALKKAQRHKGISAARNHDCWFRDPGLQTPYGKLMLPVRLEKKRSGNFKDAGS